MPTRLTTIADFKAAYERAIRAARHAEAIQLANMTLAKVHRDRSAA
jgi:hypothetical protein